MQAELPEAVEAPAGDGREVEGGRPVAAHPVGAQREIPVVMNVRVARALDARETRREQARRQPLDVRNVDALPIQESALASGRREKLGGDRLVDDAGNQLAVLFEPDGNGEARVAVSKIRRAVERVHVPAVPGIRLEAAALFRHDRMLRKVAAQSRDDGLFGFTVGLRDDVYFALVTDLGRVVELRHQNTSGFERGFDGYFQVGIHRDGGRLKEATPPARCNTSGGS